MTDDKKRQQKAVFIRVTSASMLTVPIFCEPRVGPAI